MSCKKGNFENLHVLRQKNEDIYHIFYPIKG